MAAHIQPIDFKDLKVNDVVIVTDDGNITMAGIVLSKKVIENSGNVVYVRLGNKVRNIFVDDFLAEPDGTHKVYEPYTIVRVLCNIND